MYNKILKKEIKSIVKNKLSYLLFYFILPLIILIPMFNSVLKNGNIYTTGKVLLSFSVSNFSFSFFLLFSFVLLNDVFYYDKITKLLETLLTTPVTLFQVLVEKSLAIALISYLIVFIDQIIMIFVFNILYSNHILVLPSVQSLIILLTAIPIFGFSIILIMGLISFASNKYKIFAFFLPLMIFGFLFYSSSNIRTFNPKWITVIISLILSLVLLSVSLFFSKKLKNEDVIKA